MWSGFGWSTLPYVGPRIRPEESHEQARLIYFDFAGSRGEECRIALHLAGIDFEDVRVKRGDWPAMKAGHALR